ncbi:MAG: molybdopterin cofactor-binding domain-containing protein [Actinomycetota bacterium]
MTGPAMTGSNQHLDILATGAARFTSDMPWPPGCLHAHPAVSPHAHARFTAVDASAALAEPGVVAVLTATDIPGENEIGGVLPGEPMLADGEVQCVGEPYALVLADSPEAAWRGAHAVTADWEELPAILDPREAFAAGSLIIPPRTFASGDVDVSWERCATVVSGRAEIGSQEHVAMETQAALALPTDAGGVVVHSGTQSPSTVQKAVARVAGLPMHAVEIDVVRLGGGFGGKEDQATLWACLAAVAALRLRRPVRTCPDRREDFRITGKRHPYQADFRLGLDDDGRFVAYEARLFQDAGCVADLSAAILERSLFHATNAYAVPNVRVMAASCRTNLPSNTAFRGFGGPQGIFVFECALRAAARELGVVPEELQQRNLLSEGDVLHYGMRAEHVRARASWEALDRVRPLAEARAEAAAWNAGNPRVLRGVAVQPVCFGISFTTTLLNQAEALVHVYVDGTVVVTTGAIEMGQGVQGNIRRVAARTLGVPEVLVHHASTNTLRVANVSATAASTGSDLNGAAAREACLSILAELRPLAAARLGCAPDDVEFADGVARVRPGASSPDPAPAQFAPAEMAWRDVVAAAHVHRVRLSALAHYATPNLHFDRVTNTGKPFHYHVYGAALVEVSVDVLLGTVQVDKVTVVHDAGISIDELTDRGQIEGGIVQGLGWVTSEEILHSEDGRLLTDTLSTFKIPDLQSSPELDVHFLGEPNPVGLMGSKAVGEPPLIYGLGGFFAIQDALASWRSEAAGEFRAPMTSERVFRLLHGTA